MTLLMLEYAVMYIPMEGERGKERERGKETGREGGNLTK